MIHAAITQPMTLRRLRTREGAAQVISRYVVEGRTE